MYDSTGQYNSGFETLKAARLGGYDIVMHYNTASPESLNRNLEVRSATDPRSLPGHFNAAVMNRNYEIMPAVAKSADEFYLWDSTDIGSRRLLVEKTDAKSPINVLDVNAYVHGKFDDNGQTVKRGGRPTARIPQMRFATGSLESKVIDRFEQGQSVEEIAAAMPAVPQDHIFDIVTLGYVDPNMVYTPPRPNQAPKPPMETAKKVDDFVEDDQLKSKWDSLDQSEKQIVKDVLAKKPNALDRFEETNI